jgi:protein-export membrane protein SecD/preprotein translocase SecF subunit
MKTNLLIRFLIILFVTVIASLIAWYYPPRLGIDLAGGTSLLYELDMTKVPPGSESDLAARVIDILKKRVDPNGVKNMIWRVVEGKRIQIQMPYPSKEVLAARAAYDAAEKALEETMWKQSEIEAIAGKAAHAATPADRQAELAKFLDEKITLPADPAARQPIAEARKTALDRLEALTSAWQKLDAAKSKLDAVNPTNWTAEDILARSNAQSDYNEALKAALAQSVDPNYLTNLMKAADSYENKDAQTDLAALPDKYPLQKDQILAVVAAHKAELRLGGGGVDSPEELQRLVTKAGVLDFRIAVLPGELGADQQAAFESLKQRGPEQQVRANGTTARWFEIDPNGKDNLTRGGYVTSLWAGQPYILCYDDHDHTLTHSDPKRKPWSVTANNPYSDPNSGGLVLPFKLDPVGGSYMGDLTGLNKSHPMAILLDDRAMSAPNIQSQINDSGVITFGQASASHPIDAILKEAQQLKQIMDAGSLPATLQSEPISVENISPDMGADNITAGMRSSLIAVLAVMVFMFAYYTITGGFANVALMLNLVLVLATMAMVRGTFTMPGIAGLVLTLGMAVDANVLINERIREEVHRGASLWMAVKLGYDRVFWTIFDSNLTTALTSVVLIFVGTEEVKGFGVTLLIGLAIQFFTALYVTRTFMIAAVKWGVIRAVDDHSVAEYFREILTFTWLRKGHWPFMKVVTVSNIDWLGKRHYFWVASGIFTVVGLAAFFIRGEDKYDIEFRGGTQVTFQLKDPLADVEQSILSLSADRELVKTHPELKDLGARLKDMKTLAERETEIQKIAELLAADNAVAQAHPEVRNFPRAIATAAAQKTLTLDEVRQRITALHTKPGLAELAGARVYSVGNVADRRYQMQTTIANAPQNLEETLPVPLKTALGPALKNGDVKITHDSSATHVTFALAPVGNQYLSDKNLNDIFVGLKDKPGLQDLEYPPQIAFTGKPEEHRVEVTIPNRGIHQTLLKPLSDAFLDVLEIKPKLSIKYVADESMSDLIDSKRIIVPIVGQTLTLNEVFAKTEYASDLQSDIRDMSTFAGGAAIMLDDITPAISADKLKSRIATIRRSSEFSNVPNRDFAIFPITVIDAAGKPVKAVENDARPMTRAVLVTVDPSHPYDENDDNRIAQWRTKVAGTEWKILRKALEMEDLFEGVTSFDAVVAAQAKIRALVAIMVSLFLIVVYVWIRFGGFRYGIGAIVSLVHDAIMALAATVLSGWVYTHLFGQHPYLMITDFKINLTMIAAYLTVIGYSVNDTIVIFDRVRENRGKSQTPLTAKLINDAINQCFGRTIWTSFTVITVLVIQYIWGGDGMHGFAFAMLIGCFVGVYSTLAIASPMLLATGTGQAKTLGPSPFIRKDTQRSVPELTQGTEP